jgi:hypothetical protein
MNYIEKFKCKKTDTVGKKVRRKYICEKDDTALLKSYKLLCEPG